MKVVLFTNARNESHLKEWSAHHLLIGFDNIIIFDHKSNIPIQHEFQGFDSRVRIINCSHMNGGVKMPLMNHAVSIAKSIQADWMLYLDADEFVVLNKKNIVGIKHFLTLFPNTDQLAVNWLMYGTSHLIPELSLTKGECILNSYIHSDENLNQHVKCFVRPNAIIKADNPHFFRIHNPSRSIGIDGRQYTPPFHTISMSYHKAPIFIAHYLYQSENTYRKRKLLTPRDDNGGMRTDNDVKQIHQHHNGTENFLASYKYAPQVKAFLEHKGVITKK